MPASQADGREGRGLGVGLKLKHPNVVWAFLFVSNESERDIETFLLFGDTARFLAPSITLTVYHARRRIPGLKDLEENCRLDIVSSDLRFMAMAPGGDNPGPTSIRRRAISA